jgi:hypothetical protein
MGLGWKKLPLDPMLRYRSRVNTFTMHEPPALRETPGNPEWIARNTRGVLVRFLPEVEVHDPLWISSHHEFLTIFETSIHTKTFF